MRWVGLVPIAATAASCLVTSSTDLDDPEQTPPVLLADSATPDLREIVVVQGSERVTFSALVRSEEDLGERIQVKLLIDYGVENAQGKPYRTSISGASLPAGTSQGEDRIASVSWVPEGITGCHTFTLVVSHAFDDLTEGCPEVRADSSHLTWFGFVCGEGQVCPPPVIDPRIDCPKPVTRCPENADEAATSAP